LRLRLRDSVARHQRTGGKDQREDEAVAVE